MKIVWTIAGCLALLFFAGIVALLGSTASEGDIVSIRGLGNSGNTVYSRSSRRSLLRSLRLDQGGPEVTDAMVRAMVASVLERAAKGEPDAVDFALELARVQRETAASAPPTPAAR
jgi:hypothetical protein